MLAELGAQVEEVSIPLTRHANTISSVLRVEAPTNYRELIRERLQEIKHDNRISYLTWSLTPALAYYKALKLRALLRQEVLAALENADVLVMPTMGSAAPKIEPDPIIDSKERSPQSGGADHLFQSGQRSRVEHVLRLHLGAPAHRPPDRGKTVRGADGPERGLRVPASHRLAWEKATDLDGRYHHPNHPQCVPLRAYDWEANR